MLTFQPSSQPQIRRKHHEGGKSRQPTTPKPPPQPAPETSEEPAIDRPGLAFISLFPELGAATTIEVSGGVAGIDLKELLSAFCRLANLPAETRRLYARRIALAQAKTLDCLFQKLVQLGFTNLQDPSFEILMKLGFKAQAQCTRTLATLTSLSPADVEDAEVDIQEEATGRTASAPARSVVAAHQPRACPTELNDDRPSESAVPANTSFRQKQELPISNRSNGWTPERRQRQSEMIRRWQPWNQSTGPRTARGRARSSRNADKGGTRNRLRALSALLRASSSADRASVPLPPVGPA